MDPQSDFASMGGMQRPAGIEAQSDSASISGNKFDEPFEKRHSMSDDEPHWPKRMRPGTTSMDLAELEAYAMNGDDPVKQNAAKNEIARRANLTSTAAKSTSTASTQPATNKTPAMTVRHSWAAAGAIRRAAMAQFEDR